MKILYVGIHSHVGWGAEYWLARAFSRLGHTLHCYDYGERRRCLERHRRVARELRETEQQFAPDVLFLQRARNLPPSALDGLTTPRFFWSTEPICLKRDVDTLLRSDLFSWVWVHSYSCLGRIRREFSHLENICSVMHNACPAELIDFSTAKDRFAIFNRNLSPRRRQWLRPSAGLVDIVRGRFGELYFADLGRSHVSVNVHYSGRNLDDFESGILEAMAKDCVVVSEALNPQTVADLGMTDAIVQVDSPNQLRDRLLELQQDPSVLESYRVKARAAIRLNTWDARAELFTAKFREMIPRSAQSRDTVETGAGA